MKTFIIKKKVEAEDIRDALAKEAKAEVISIVEEKPTEDKSLGYKT